MNIAITAITAITLTLFNNWFEKEYDDLRKITYQIFHSEDIYEDYFNESYIRMRKAITTREFDNPTALNFRKYFHQTARNEYTRYLRDKKKNVDISQTWYESEAEQEMQYQCHDKQLYHERNDITVRLLFKYVEVFHPKHEHLWKSYYLNPTTQTYKDLSERTGLSFSYIDKVVRNLKKDVRKNFSKWANENKNLIKI